MVEIKELQNGVEVDATGYREKFKSRFEAILVAYALAQGESAAQGGRQVEIIVPTGWGEGYMVGQSTGQHVVPSANGCAWIDATSGFMLNARSAEGPKIPPASQT